MCGSCGALAECASWHAGRCRGSHCTRSQRISSFSLQRRPQARLLSCLKGLETWNCLASLWMEVLSGMHFQNREVFHPYWIFVLESNFPPQSAYLEFPSYQHRTYHSLSRYVMNIESFQTPSASRKCNTVAGSSLFSQAHRLFAVALIVTEPREIQFCAWSPVPAPRSLSMSDIALVEFLLVLLPSMDKTLHQVPHCLPRSQLWWKGTCLTCER